MKLVLATRNEKKLVELRRILAPLVDAEVVGLADVPAYAEVPETGATFAENAVLKARAYARATALWTLADDSGLEVAALGGAPGLYSARYAGPGATDEQRRQRLLAELAATGDAGRRARFVCALALAHPARAGAEVFEGVCEGHIAPAPRGTGGFGYDPVFVPDGYAQTFGELPEEIKQRISHRARALATARAYITTLLPNAP